jgi:arylsulfatase A-like enzyme
VHFPHYPHHEFIGKSGVSLQKDWALEVDDSAGQILGALRELKLEQKTLVVFTSDNGGPTNQRGDNTPLRGSKGSTLEGGIRVCTIAWWPGKIAPASQTKAITAHMDWLPTFASICAAKIQSNRKLDGKDISPVLFGKGDQTGHDVFHYYLGFNLQAVRSGPWKLHLGKDELYNLESDIGETENVAKDHAEIVSKLKQYADEIRADLGDKTAEAPGVRPLGRVSEPLPLISSDGVVRPGFDRLFKILP